ncbi:hypothetical protein DFH08DRAFT_963477 [Mycena albidolilacea]|uniref:Uncharacterized protein n=1 Tax=Mycena albidolilacea TaxID=1033008 RepID=A0AAD7EPF1_9AGAR|nr:hypothetical protein DFH08DRAFT_963477 [Mycena albidolilacea]
MAGLEALLKRLPNTVLEQFRDESFPTNFSTKHPQIAIVLRHHPNLDWDPSLASFFDSVEATVLSSGSDPFLETTEPCAARGSSDIVVPLVISILTSAPSPVPPLHSNSPMPLLSTRRSSRKQGAFKTHEDAPVQKSKKTEAAVAPEPSDPGKQRPKRKPKAWSVRHTDDQIYTSFEFLAQFPEEYRALYGDTQPGSYIFRCS